MMPEKAPSKMDHVSFAGSGRISEQTILCGPRFFSMPTTELPLNTDSEAEFDVNQFIWLRI